MILALHMAQYYWPIIMLQLYTNRKNSQSATDIRMLMLKSGVCLILYNKQIYNEQITHKVKDTGDILDLMYSPCMVLLSY